MFYGQLWLLFDIQMEIIPKFKNIPRNMIVICFSSGWRVCLNGGCSPTNQHKLYITISHLVCGHSHKSYPPIWYEHNFWVLFQDGKVSSVRQQRCCVKINMLLPFFKLYITYFGLWDKATALYNVLLNTLG